MSKLGLPTGENHCVIKFACSIDSQTHQIHTDTGTFEKPVWWCTKDNDDFFNMPEQLYTVIAWQKIGGYISIYSSRLIVYNSLYSSGGKLPITNLPYGSMGGTDTTYSSRVIWIEYISKMKIDLVRQSAGALTDYWVDITPL